MGILHFINKKNMTLHSTIKAAEFMSDRQMHLKYMHLNELWLKCTCTEVGAFSFTKRQHMKYVLVNHPVKGKHRKGCQLYTQISGEINQSHEKPSVNAKAPKSFNLLKISPGIEGKQKGQSLEPKNNSRSRSDKVHTLLSHGFCEKYLNTILPNKQLNLNALYYSKMFDLKVTQSAKGFAKLKDLTFILPNDKAREYRHKLNQLKHLFAANTPLQCNFIFTTANAHFEEDRKGFHYEDNGQLKFINSMRSTHHYERTSGPRIVFMTVALIDDKWVNYLLYSHPVVSEQCPVLVDSNLERQFAMQFMQHANNGDKLIKPYIPIVFKETTLLPDFILTRRGKQMIVEVMGLMDNDDYRERKSRIVPLMEQRYGMPVIELSPNEVKSGSTKIFDCIGF